MRVPEANAGDAAQDPIFGREEYDRHATKVCVSRLLDSKDGFQVGDDINDKASEDESGYSLATTNDGMILAIGAKNNNGTGRGVGHVYVFARDVATNHIQNGSDINGEAEFDESGYSLAISTNGGIVAIGATSNGVTGPGAVRMFVWDGVTNYVRRGLDINGEAAYSFSGV